MEKLSTFVLLDLDHPGAKDQEYKARRNKIADLANKFWDQNDGLEIPLVEYADSEVQTWKEVLAILDELHGERACSTYMKARGNLSLSGKNIPQMRELSAEIESFFGFRLNPIGGLVDSRNFLGFLSKKIMLCTQYVRHHSRPTFTPEPDLIHEFVGHAPMFTNPEIVEFSELIGKAAMEASPEQLQKLERLYWFTLEYGLIEEKGKVKAFGAGLLAGIEDSNNAFKSGADLRDFDIQKVLNEQYDFSSLQNFYYVIPSFEFLKKETSNLLESFSIDKIQGLD